MADYDTLTYCKLVGLYNGIAGDSTGFYGDEDTRPDLYTPNMVATISLTVGDEKATPELRLTSATPPRTIMFLPIDARIESGVLRLPGQAASVNGVEVLAKSSIMGLGDTPLVCNVAFSPVTINGARYQYAPFKFALPTIEPAAYAAGRVQVVTITGGPTGGLWRLYYDAIFTATLTHMATALQVQTALRALVAIGNNVTVAGADGGPYTVTFTGALGAGNPSPLKASEAFTGGEVPDVEIEDQYTPTIVDLTTVTRITP